MASIARLFACAAMLLVAACESNPEPKMPRLDGIDPAPEFPGQTGARVKTPITSVKRADVKWTLDNGPGYFLQNVVLEEWPVMRDGKFHGFKIQSINDTWIIDLKAGDVVTRVNGMVVEKPDDAISCLRALEKAPALKVDYERNGMPRVLELPIVD
ncbi:MAG: hypothetical protein KIT84_27880 [Labilithrix sp.]|nr:hypothetical protein [Labilithrix sp.]MCW5814880.1 hypothetical protein [Labilithrix sp.]